MEDITVKELKEKRDRNEEFYLLDVREQYEYDEFNLGGDLLPVGSLLASLDRLASHKDEEIIVHCRSGNRSKMAKELLTREGFTKVRNLQGGIVAWIEEFGLHA